MSTTEKGCTTKNVWMMRSYDPALFTETEAAALKQFEAETGFAPQTQKFECGEEDFWQCWRGNVQWFQSWAADAASRLRRVEPIENRSPFGVIHIQGEKV